jgi:hypothetical protein
MKSEINFAILFKLSPTFEITQSLLICFNLKDLNDCTWFSKYDIIKYETCNKVIEMLPDLALYYLPCKYKYYLGRELTPRRAITILNHFVLFTKKYKIETKEYIKNGKKTIFYKIFPISITPKLKIQKNVLFTFD